MRPPTLEGHNLFVQTPFLVFSDSMEIPLSLDSSMCMWRAVGTGAGRQGQVGQGRSGRAGRVGLAIHV